MYICRYESAKLPHGRPFPLPKDHDGNDLIHVGSFCHFIPKDGTCMSNNMYISKQHNISYNMYMNTCVIREEKWTSKQCNEEYGTI